MSNRITLSLEDIERKILDLRREADELERFRKLAISIGDPVVELVPRNAVPKSKRANQPRKHGEHSASPYVGMGAKRAAIKYLRHKGSPESLAVLARALVQGGLKTASNQFHRTLHNTLVAASKKKNTEVVRSGKRWALKEWTEGSKSENNMP